MNFNELDYGFIALKLDKFSQFVRQPLHTRRYSEQVYIGGLPWKMYASIGEHGIKKKKQNGTKMLGLFLKCNYDGENEDGWSCEAKYNLTIYSPKNGFEIVNDSNHTFANGIGYGDPFFIEISVLQDPSNGWLDPKEDAIYLAAWIWNVNPKGSLTKIVTTNIAMMKKSMSAEEMKIEIQSLRQSIPRKADQISQLEHRQAELNNELEQSKVALAEKELENQELKRKFDREEKVREEVVGACLTLKRHLNGEIGSHLEEMNEKLRVENDVLKARLTGIEQEFQSLRKSNDTQGQLISTLERLINPQHLEDEPMNLE